jgi:hypothetical protein
MTRRLLRSAAAFSFTGKVYLSDRESLIMYARSEMREMLP